MNLSSRANTHAPSDVSDTILFLPLRRNHPRYPVQKIASYNYGGRSFLTLTLDLGMGGMKIKAHHDIPEDECLAFKLVLGERPIFPKGRIVYSRFLADTGSVSGIQFVEISQSDRNLLNDYLGALKTSLEPLILPVRRKAGNSDERA